MLALPLPRPSEWAKVVEFAPPKQGDNTGLISLKGARTIQLTTLVKKGLPFRTPTLPLECTTIAEFMGSKGRGNLSVAIELTPELWDVFHGLDLEFQAFMIANARKLFSAKDAEYIARDNSAIVLKQPKPLARYRPDGTPDYSTLLRFRISGRGAEVSGFDVKEGSRDSSSMYVTNVQYKDQIDALPPNATRLCMATGTGADGTKRVATLLRRNAEATTAPGARKMRYVGPGDMRKGNILDAKFAVSHWALVNGAGSICLRLTDCIFENIDDVQVLPEGFVLANDEEEPPLLALPPPLTPHDPRLAKVVQEPPAAPARPPTKRQRFEAASSATSAITCEGCKADAPDQKSHMGMGGCLAQGDEEETRDGFD